MEAVFACQVLNVKVNRNLIFPIRTEFSFVRKTVFFQMAILTLIAYRHQMAVDLLPVPFFKLRLNRTAVPTNDYFQADFLFFIFQRFLP